MRRKRINIPNFMSAQRCRQEAERRRQLAERASKAGDKQQAAHYQRIAKVYEWEADDRERGGAA